MSGSVPWSAEEFVDEAPPPGLAGFVRAHDRVVLVGAVPAHVPPRRRVAAGHQPAGQADAQVDPVVEATGDALRTTGGVGRRGRRITGFREVLAGQSSLRFSWDSSRSRTRWARVSTSSGIRPSLRATLKTCRSALIISRRSRPYAADGVSCTWLPSLSQ